MPLFRGGCDRAVSSHEIAKAKRRRPPSPAMHSRADGGVCNGSRTFRCHRFSEHVLCARPRAGPGKTQRGDSPNWKGAAANGYGISFGVDENVPDSIVVMVA